MTQLTSKLVSPVTLIQQLLDSAGQACHGPVILKKTKLSQKHLTIDIALTVSCARNSDTGQMMVASPLPSPANPSSPSESSKISNPNTSAYSLPIWNGKDGWTVSYDELVTLLASLDVSVGSLEDATIPQSSERQLLTIHREAWLT